MKYEVIKEFIDKYNPSRSYKVGEVIDISPERAIEILSVDKLIKELKPKETKKSKKTDRVVE